MKITGQTSINKLDDYIKLQKAQGNSIKGHYTLFLKQIEQSNILGQTFNNYVLDILKRENLESIKPTTETIEKSKELSTNNKPNVNNTVINQDITSNMENKEVIPKASKKSTSTKTASKKEVKSKTDSKEQLTTENQTINKPSSQTQIINSDYKDYYLLLKTYKEKIKNKQGNEKEYLMGEFYDVNDKQYLVAINPSDAEEFSKCQLGTAVNLEIQEASGKLFATKLSYVNKNIAA